MTPQRQKGFKIFCLKLTSHPQRQNFENSKGLKNGIFTFHSAASEWKVEDKLRECKNFHHTAVPQLWHSLHPIHLFIGISINKYRYNIKNLSKMHHFFIFLPENLKNAVSNESDCSSNNEDKYSRLLHWFSIH